MLKKLLATLAVIMAFAVPFQAASAGQSSDVVQAGTFEGRSDHIVKGGVSILKTASGYIAVLEKDFDLDGAPAPTLGFGKGEKFDASTEFTKLHNDKGLQVYAIPANVNPADYDSFFVWCADFSVPLGVAKLSK
ncbi:DM13 domain-containing protein [Kiloniella sp. b19]|uniref:DM13 domain-containing protein n=1 Tax=Kiloniella sp. GXU_MW_B19 TaxID=3141326 RepID=UPI0031DFC343